MTQKIANAVPVEYSLILISNKKLMKILDVSKKIIERR